MSDEKWTLSPKGCAVVALLDAEIINDIDDGRVNKFWRLFQSNMLKHGYIECEQEDNNNE